MKKIKNNISEKVLIYLFTLNGLFIILCKLILTFITEYEKVLAHVKLVIAKKKIVRIFSF